MRDPTKITRARRHVPMRARCGDGARRACAGRRVLCRPAGGLGERECGLDRRAQSRASRRRSCDGRCRSRASMERQMKSMRSRLVLIAAISVGGFAACNETVGECWYYGEGSENTSAGPGGGVIVPTGPAGVGGYGEAPPKEPQDDRGRPPPECNEGEEDETELGELVCKQPTWGLTCSGLCVGYGVSCPAGYRHNVTDELGQLFK